MIFIGDGGFDFPEPITRDQHIRLNHLDVGETLPRYDGKKAKYISYLNKCLQGIVLFGFQSKWSGFDLTPSVESDKSVLPTSFSVEAKAGSG